MDRSAPIIDFHTHFLVRQVLDQCLPYSVATNRGHHQLPPHLFALFEKDDESTRRDRGYGSAANRHERDLISSRNFTYLLGRAFGRPPTGAATQRCRAAKSPPPPRALLSQEFALQDPSPASLVWAVTHKSAQADLVILRGDLRGPHTKNAEVRSISQ
jgi:hypothetical protein